MVVSGASGVDACHGRLPWVARLGRIRPWFDVAPRAGLLVLFPACIDHAVLENDDDDRRFSISMDFVLTAPAETSAGGRPEYLAPHPGGWQQVAGTVGGGFGGMRVFPSRLELPTARVPSRRLGWPRRGR